MWQSTLGTLKPKHFIIKESKPVGFYLYIYENDICIRDYLQDTYEIAVEMAAEDFGVPKNSWKKVNDNTTVQT